MKLWQGETITSDWLVTLKLDGVQAVYKNGVALSRKGKVLYNLPPMPDGIYEVYLGGFKESLQATRTKNTKVQVLPSDLFRLEPIIDPSLIIHGGSDFDTEEIRQLLLDVLESGYEGLVLRGPNGERLKIKPFETYDVFITGLQEGTNKNKGKLGALITDMGKIGTGFTDKDRTELWNPDIIGEVVEVECMHLTDNGKFRHPRFKRIRYDKAEESKPHC